MTNRCTYDQKVESVSQTLRDIEKGYNVPSTFQVSEDLIVNENLYFRLVKICSSPFLTINESNV